MSCKTDNAADAEVDENEPFESRPLFRGSTSSEKRNSSNRLSKVLANVKLFEAKAETKDTPPGGANTTEDGAKSIVAHKSSVRKRTSYLEVRILL